MMQRFDCDDVGELKEYVGCTLDWNKEEKWLKFTQPFLLQSYQDEFQLPSDGKFATPAEPGQVLIKRKPENDLITEKQCNYRKGVGKLLHMMRWSRPEILNSVRVLVVV